MNSPSGNSLCVDWYMTGLEVAYIRVLMDGGKIFPRMKSERKSRSGLHHSLDCVSFLRQGPTS